MFILVFHCKKILILMIFHKLLTAEPVIYVHPTVPHILLVNDSGLKTEGHNHEEME